MSRTPNFAIKVKRLRRDKATSPLKHGEEAKVKKTERGFDSWDNSKEGSYQRG